MCVRWGVVCVVISSTCVTSSLESKLVGFNSFYRMCKTVGCGIELCVVLFTLLSF